MKLYTMPFAPNALRAQIFMQEKAIEVETVSVTPENRAEYLKLNPLGQVPSLVLDDGTVITESLTICEYLDAVSPAPRLFGSDPEERARIGMWERRAEMLLFIPSVEYGHHVHPMFAGRLTQFPDWARSLTPKASAFVEVMAERLASVPFLAGESFSAADITAYLGYSGFIAFGGITPSESKPVKDWANRIGRRDSMAILAQLAALLEMKPLA